jgi:serine/threonine protein kinase
MSRSFPGWAEPRYRCIKRISQATTATVWLVRRAGDGMRLHVLKELHSAESSELVRDADWPREMALLTSQKHPFILPVVEMIRDEATGQIGMVTEYCDQGDLHSLLIELRKRGERVPESQLLSWLAQLCLALSHLHRQRSASRAPSLPPVTHPAQSRPPTAALSVAARQFCTAT